MMQKLDNRKFKKIQRIGVSVLAVVIAAVVLSISITTPANPINDKLAVSSMWSSSNEMLVNQELLDSMDNANIVSGKIEKTSVMQQQGEQSQNEQENQDEQPDDNNQNSDAGSDQLSQLEQIENSSTGAGESSSGSSGNESNTDDGQNPEGEGGSVAAYFTTSIINGDTLSDKNYSFTIKHMKPELKVAGIAITHNGEEKTYAPKKQRFELKLSEGENVITVNVVYQTEENSIEASKTYRVFYAPKGKVVIVTDLTNREIDQPDLTFKAYGLRGEEKLKADVKVNGKKVSGSSNYFQAELEMGDNTISITAGGRNDSVTQNYTVTYTDKVFKVTTTISDTVLYGTEGDNAKENVVYTGPNENLRFKVWINKITGKEKIKKIRFYSFDGTNGKIIKPDSEGYYNVELPTRKGSLIYLTYLDSDGAEHTYTYQMRFKREGEATPAGKEPKLYAMVEVGNQVMNLENGMEFKAPGLILNLNGKSWNNEQLYYNHYQVTINGVTHAQHSYQSGTWFGYDAYLKEGANTIKIVVTDEDMYSATYMWTVYYTPGNVKVTVSVEATTVGLGYLVPPTTVEVEGGTNAAQIVTDLLEQHGYGYIHTGAIENGFYLAHITKAGITNGYHIPEDLKETILADGMDEGYKGVPGSSDSLGEFDFYRWSGWMYSYNGSYPGYSMASCMPQDGSVIRVRFTLALGKDIGGFKATGAYYGNISGNYHKQW